MAVARFAVIRFPGTNCERETVRVLREVLEQSVDEPLWHADPRPLDEYDCVILPGGFAHGDHLRAGAIARFSAIMADVERYAARGGLVLGICNGFQVLLEAGLLPGAMLRNATLQFRGAWVHCRVERTDSPFTAACQPGQVLRLPIAHGEGSYAVAGPEDLERLERAGAVLLRYSDPAGAVTAAANPNGSLGNIAGITNPRGNVFGLMPHPERACESLLGSVDGMPLLRSIVQHVTTERGEASVTRELSPAC
ncbi:MAG: phosphoribosylformylglycinamidine synthase I [Chloroflexi bacterium]|nr:phosphoribosylformylglycinamidine synthase I [Chloroflexota bacterium]